MLFDNFDKKIKEAAEQHHPAYDENAWRKMESLLNEHLPQQKGRRRFFLLAFSILLIGGGAFFLLSKPHSTSPTQVTQQTPASTSVSTQADKTDKTGVSVQPATNSSTEGATAAAVKGLPTKIGNKDGNGLGITSRNLIGNAQSQQETSKDGSLINSTSTDMDKGIITAQTEQKNNQTVSTPVASQADNKLTKDEAAVSNAITKGTEAQRTQPAQNSQVTKTTPQTNKPQRNNGFSFFVSAGPDISKAQNSKAGKVTISYGFGVAYTLNRFTLKTGIFSATKKYWAGPDDYKLSYTPPPSLKFMGADANCRVTEIPVKLSYSFARKSRSNWFAGAGLSSYLMKREEYLYEYKSVNSGNSYYRPYETKNENKHYFSILNVSGGYNYQLSKTISLSAEPYIEVPMTGIGAGKVHLNSGGILFSVGVSPFRK